jgi:hypothetical protein
MTAALRLVLLSALLLSLSPPARAQFFQTQPPPNPELQKFDGKWATTVTCKNVKAPAAPVQFITEVENGELHGRSGTEGAPGYLQIDGNITAAGLGHVYVKGLTAKDENVVGRDISAGSEYKYYVQAKFEGKSGAGNRVEGRSCAIKFEKK